MSWYVCYVISLQLCWWFYWLSMAFLWLLNKLSSILWMRLSSLVLMFRQVGAEEAERFCKAFQQIHKKLVCAKYLKFKSLFHKIYYERYILYNLVSSWKHFLWNCLKKVMPPEKYYFLWKWNFLYFFRRVFLEGLSFID